MSEKFNIIKRNYAGNGDNMKTANAVQNRIFELCMANNITINGLANKSGLSPSTLKNIMYGVSKNPGIVTIKIICDGLNISLSEFFNCDLFKNHEQEIE